MKQRSSVCLMKWLALMLASLLSLSGIAAEPVKGVQIPSAIDLTLPIHQKQKLHPELFDPVLGDQAQIVEWAWSPQYAKRFNLPVQPDGLKDGGLWLIGVKVQRIQNQQWQRYTCNIVGVMQNDLPILTPPGEQYVMHPDYGWMGGMPGVEMKKALAVPTEGSFAPAQSAWYRHSKNKQEEKRPYTGIGFPYKYFYRYFQQDLAYFEWEGGCGYFSDPEKFRNEIRFPTRIDGKNDEDKLQPAVYEPSAVHFDIPDGLMRRIYPYTLEADDWTSCLMHRVGSSTLTTHALKSKRFGNTCEPITQKQK